MGSHNIIIDFVHARGNPKRKRGLPRIAYTGLGLGQQTGPYSHAAAVGGGGVGGSDDTPHDG